MNANELADELIGVASVTKPTDDGVTYGLAGYCIKAATMLRQQQAEIEALKKDNKELHAIAQRMAMAESDARKSLQWFKDAKEKQNEPVAWMEPITKSVMNNDEYQRNLFANETGDWIPLYTAPQAHPAKTKLSRMEVYELAIDSGFMLSTQYGQAENKLMPASDGDTLVKLAEAILRKASEK